MIDFDLILQSIPALLRGTLLSLAITLTAALLGLTLGLVLTLLERSQHATARALALGYITLFRGTPVLVQILFVYFVLPQFGLDIAPFLAASMALGFNSAAYVSQIIGCGINAVPVGQVEAAQTLGMNQRVCMQYIVFPQALRTSLPALGNELISLVKDSSLASIIGVMELSKEASLIRSRTYDAFSILLASSLIYLTVTSAISLLFRKAVQKRC